MSTVDPKIAAALSAFQRGEIPREEYEAALNAGREPVGLSTEARALLESAISASSAAFDALQHAAWDDVPDYDAADRAVGAFQTAERAARKAHPRPAGKLPKDHGWYVGQNELNNAMSVSWALIRAVSKRVEARRKGRLAAFEREQERRDAADLRVARRIVGEIDLRARRGPVPLETQAAIARAYRR